MPAKKTTRRPSPPSPQDLLMTELRGIYSAETQLMKALPRLTKVVESEAFRELLARRQEEGQALIDAIDAAFAEMDGSPGRRKNVAAEGLIADALQYVQEMERGPGLDAALVAALQKTEHYCIAAWGTARSIAEALDQSSVVEAMETAIEEGKALDEELTEIAEGELYPALMSDGEEEEEEPEETPRSRGRKSTRREARA